MVRISPGESAELSARVTGHPDPVIAWERSNEAITNSGKYTVSARSSPARSQAHHQLGFSSATTATCSRCEWSTQRAQMRVGTP